MRRMIKLWRVVWYFTRPDRPNDTGVPSWHDEISRGEFIYYLAHQKMFRENWVSTLRRYYYLGIIGKWPSTTNPLEQKRIKGQHKEINDLIDKVLNPKYGYLLVSRTTSQYPSSSEIFLTIDWRGREFINNPLIFFNALFKEYGYVTSFIFGSGGTLILIFWNVIIEFITKIFP
ncbi:MAG: hypothetical protein Q7S34_04715 [bacterium]|nr:hypothetical protein [bacterium]